MSQISKYYLINTVTTRGNEFDPDLSNNTSTVTTEVNPKPYGEMACIIVPKVFSSCQKRECLKDVKITLPQMPLTFETIRFSNGQSANQRIIPLEQRPGWASVEFDVNIPFTLCLKHPSDGMHTVTSQLPKIHLAVIQQYPQRRTESSLNLYVNTRSELLTPVHIEGCLATFTVGVFIISYIAGTVQLMVPSYGYCPEPIECEQYSETVIEPCESFFNPLSTVYPSDFYPNSHSDNL